VADKSDRKSEGNSEISASPLTFFATNYSKEVALP
jgi:hypothetical protein